MPQVLQDFMFLVSGFLQWQLIFKLNVFWGRHTPSDPIGKSLISPAKRHLLRCGLISAWLYLVRLGFCPFSKVVANAIAYRPQLDPFVCFCTSGRCTVIVPFSVCKRLEMVTMVS